MAEADKKKRKIAKGRHLSAFKRERQGKKRYERNLSKRSALKSSIKKLRAKPTKEQHTLTISAVNKAASRGIIPKKRASRLTSRLTKLVNAQTNA